MYCKGAPGRHRLRPRRTRHRRPRLGRKGQRCRLRHERGGNNGGIAGGIGRAVGGVILLHQRGHGGPRRRRHDQRHAFRHHLSQEAHELDAPAPEAADQAEELVKYGGRVDVGGPVVVERGQVDHVVEGAGNVEQPLDLPKPVSMVCVVKARRSKDVPNSRRGPPWIDGTASQSRPSGLAQSRWDT